MKPRIYAHQYTEEELKKMEDEWLFTWLCWQACGNTVRYDEPWSGYLITDETGLGIACWYDGEGAPRDTYRGSWARPAQPEGVGVYIQALHQAVKKWSGPYGAHIEIESTRFSQKGFVCRVNSAYTPTKMPETPLGVMDGLHLLEESLKATGPTLGIAVARCGMLFARHTQLEKETP